MSHNHRRIVTSGRWARVRLSVLRRDFYRCRVCGLAGALEVDHIRALADGGEPYAPGNLQAICRACHIQKTRAENRERRGEPEAVRRWREMVGRYPGG